MYSQQYHDSLWDVWLNGGSEMSYAEFKAEQDSKVNREVTKKEIASKPKEVRQVEEKEAIDFANQFVIPQEGG